MSQARYAGYIRHRPSVLSSPISSAAIRPRDRLSQTVLRLTRGASDGAASLTNAWIVLSSEEAVLGTSDVGDQPTGCVFFCLPVLLPAVRSLPSRLVNLSGHVEPPAGQHAKLSGRVYQAVAVSLCWAFSLCWAVNLCRPIRKRRLRTAVNQQVSRRAFVNKRF